MYLVGFAQNLDYTSNQIDDANQTTSAISVGDVGSSIIGNDGATINFGDVAPELEDIVDDNTEKDIKDIADEPIDDDLVNDFGKYLASSVDDGGFEFWMDNGIGDIDNADIQMLVDQSIELLKLKFPNLKKITLTDNATWTDTQGDDASDDKALDGGSVSKDRQDTTNNINKLLKKAIEDNFKGVDVTHVEKDAVKDSSKKFKAGSLEAKVAQKVGSTWSDIDPGNDKDITPDDTGDDDTDVDEGDLIFPPTDKIWFANKRPESVKTKYEVVFIQILPSLIGDGEPEFYKNDEFKEILKYVGTIKGEKQSFSEKFIKDRIDPNGVLQQALKDPKYKNVKDKIQNTINALDWVKFSTKNPSTLGDLFRKLDPNIKLGDRKANKALPGKAGQAAKQPGTKSTPSGKSFDTNLRETVLNEVKSILFEKYDIQNLSTFNKEAATNNLGLLVPLYSDTWGLASDEGVTGIEYDAEYLGDKYKNSLNKLKTIFPKVKTIVSKSVKLKDKETTQPTKTKDIIYLYDLDGDKYEDLFKDSNFRNTYFRATNKGEEEFEYKGQKYSNKDGGQAGTLKTSPKGTDKKEKEHSKSSRLAAIEKEIESKKSLQTILNLVDQSQEIDPFIFGLLALINDKFENDKNKLRIIIQGALNKFNQEVSKDKKLKSNKKKKGGTKVGGFNYGEKADIKEDVKKQNPQVIKALEALRTNPIIGPRLDQLISTDEAINLITDIFFDLDDPELKIFKNASSDEIKQGLERALKLFQSDPEIKKSFQNTTGKDDQETGLDVFYKGYTSSSSDYKVKEALIKEGLSEDESKAVLDKYKQRYAAVLKSNPDFIKKYPNPDKVIYGMAIKEITKLREKLGKKADVGDYKKDFRKSDAPQFKGKSKKKRDEMATAAFLSQQDKLKEGDLDVGHQDDEPRMLKKDIYNMGKYAMEIYKKLDRYDDMEGEVDFPHWWQSKLTKAKSMLQSAYDYLDGEEKISQIDAIMEKEEKLPVNDIKKAIRALLKKEGGAVGLGPILKLAKDFDGVTQIDVEDILDNDMKDVEKHRDGDYILKEVFKSSARTAEVYDRMKGDINKRKKIFGKFASRPFARLNPRDQKIVQDIVAKMKKGENIKETGEDIAKTNMKRYKEGNMEENRLTELVKAALMGPISEKKKDHNKDGKIDSEDYLIARDKAIKKAKGKIDETDMADRILDKTLNKVQDGENLLHKLIRKLKTLPNTSAQQIISQLKLKMTPAEVEALEEELRESFKSLSKDIDKQKGKTKEDGDNIAGYIKNLKRDGRGKGPTKKMKKREGIKERIFKELRK